MSFFLVACFSLGFMGQPLWGGEAASLEHKFNRDFLLRFGKDLESVVASPKDWQKSDFLKLAAVTSVGLILFVSDQRIHDWVEEHKSSSAKDAAAFFSNFGDGGWLLGGLTALYAAGELGDRDRLRQVALLSLESLTVTTLFVWSGKFVLGRSRPSTGESSASFHPFSFSSSHWSFPSGHAASAFAVATVIADESKETAVDVLAYSLAALVGVARVWQNKHWPADVFMGSAMGYFVAKKICRLNRRQDRLAVGISFRASRSEKALTLTVGF